MSARNPADLAHRAASADAHAVAAITGLEDALTGMMPIATTAGAQARGINSLIALEIPTPYTHVSGLDEVVHPSVVYIAGGFGGYEYWMAFTPYPGGANAYENPCIVASHDGLTWEVPDGLTNPVFERSSGTGDFLSDPCLHHANGILHLVWRASESGVYKFYCANSSNGVEWSSAVLVMLSENRVSPAIDYHNGIWSLWSVETSGVNTITRFTGPSLDALHDETVCTYTNTTGYEPWHIAVIRTGGEYVLLQYETLEGASVRGGRLLRGVSVDGLTFDCDPQVMLVGNPAGWDTLLYASTMLPAFVDGNIGYRLWYGSYSSATGWAFGHTLVTLEPRSLVRDDLLAALVPISPYIGGDRCARADSSSTPGSLDSGQPWSVRYGTFGISGNALYTTTGGFIGIDAGVPDVEVGCTVVQLPDGLGKMLYLMCGWDGAAAASNCIRFGVVSGTTYGMSVRADSTTLYYGTDSRFTPAVGDRLRMRFSESVVTCYLNDVVMFRFRADALAGYTWVGLQLSPEGPPRANNFYVKQIR